MSEIPSDVWACAETLWYAGADGVPYSVSAAFLIRAPTAAEADAKARAILDHDVRRSGAIRGTGFRNRLSGDAAVGSINDEPLFPAEAGDADRSGGPMTPEQYADLCIDTGDGSGTSMLVPDDLYRRVISAIRDALAAEREACAVAALLVRPEWHNDRCECEACVTAAEAAAAIRKRGDE